MKSCHLNTCSPFTRIILMPSHPVNEYVKKLMRVLGVKGTSVDYLVLNILTRTLEPLTPSILIHIVLVLLCATPVHINKFAA